KKAHIPVRPFQYSIVAAGRLVICPTYGIFTHTITSFAENHPLPVAESQPCTGRNVGKRSAPAAAVECIVGRCLLALLQLSPCSLLHQTLQKETLTSGGVRSGDMQGGADATRTGKQEYGCGCCSGTLLSTNASH